MKPKDRSRLKIILVCTVLVCLLAVLVDSFRRFLLPLKETAIVHTLEGGLEMWRSEFDVYPPSDANDPNGVPYCGAMRLCEALMGRDLKGFHPKSAFRADGRDETGTRQLYPSDPDPNNLRARSRWYFDEDGLMIDGLVHRLSDIYGVGRTGPFDGNLPVLCDVFIRRHKTGIKAGMPLLYYRANPVSTVLDANNPDSPANIFNYRDNHALLALGTPRDAKARHPLTDPSAFYKIVQARKELQIRPDCAYLLISAGPDGLYGTKDDQGNFLPPKSQ